MPTALHRTALHRTALALAATLLATTSGCCLSHGCREDALPRTRLLATPFDTVDFVRYAVRMRCFDALYETLSTRTREHGGPKGEPLERFDFTFAFPRASYGDIDPNAPDALRDVKLTEIIHASQILNVVEDYPRPGMAYVFLRYDPIPESRLAFPLVDEGRGNHHRWTLGLYEWAQEQAP